MLIINLLEVNSITIAKKTYSWGLLDSNQIIYLNITDDLKSLLVKTKPIVKSFTIDNREIVITRHILQKKTGCAVPQDQLLAVAKMLIADAERNHILFHSTIKQVEIAINKEWFFTDKKDWYHFLFYMLFQDWDGDEYRKDEELKEIIADLDDSWKKTTDFKAFKKWITTENTFILRCVGDKYHLDTEDLKKIKRNQAINLLPATLNKHDNKAIGIYLTDGKQLGFIRRPVAKILHDRLNFEDYTAKVFWIDKDRYPNYRILVQVNFKKMQETKKNT